MKLPTLTPKQKKAVAVALAAVVGAIAAFTDVPDGIETAVALLAQLLGG